MKQPDSKRQEKSRAARKALGLNRKEIIFSDTELAEAEACATWRGYDLSEYLKTLIRKDAEKVAELKANLGRCSYCDKSLPVRELCPHRGHRDCFKTLEHRIMSL